MACAKLYDRKHALGVADDLHNDRVRTDRGTEYCGQRAHHEYELSLSREGIDHTKTKAQRPQTNGICERFHKTIQEEFYATAFRTKLYTSIEELQADLDGWLEEYNRERPHADKDCFSTTPPQCFADSRQLA